jgi:hypothetical protein
MPPEVSYSYGPRTTASSVFMKEPSVLNAVSRFDETRFKRLHGLPKFAQPALYAVGALLAVAFVFQFFFRYQYLENNGVLWRVDRLTQQMCQVNIGEARCKISPSTATSLSVSPSLSTSTSVSLKVKVPKKH